jgi:tRNA pseudouridine38-40 synthase
VTARLLIEYDGSQFAGWARQPGHRTVQAELEEALARVSRSERRLTVAGRTDAGVHARGQVASHGGAPARASALNGVLPRDLRVLESVEAPEGFDARRDATSRTYRYRLLTRTVASPFERGRALHWPHRLERGVLDRCAAALLGAHDFTAFTPTQTDHVRFERHVLRSEWVEAGGEILEFWIEADSFMRHMVRVLVGTMLAVAGGRIPEEAFGQLLDGRPREEAGDTAQAHGLYLEHVSYGGESPAPPDYPQ